MAGGWWPGAVAEGTELIAVQCPARTVGRYVTLSQSGAYLNFCEVQVGHCPTQRPRLGPKSTCCPPLCMHRIAVHLLPLLPHRAPQPLAHAPRQPSQY